jgi:hypothetical protein
MIPSIFNRFPFSRRRSARRSRGTGLGLCRLAPAGIELLEARRLLSWTVMGYLDGDNSLGLAIEAGFYDLRDVSAPPEVRVVAEMDGVIASGARRGEVLSTSTADDTWGDGLGQVNMGDPNTLHAFLQWAVTNYPADHYVLILADHGGGLDGVCYDVHAGDDVITLPELSAALTGIPKLDVIGMDACVMSMVEVAYQLSGKADFLVASEAPSPMFGWPYDTALGALAGNPQTAAETLAGQIVDAFADQFGPDGSDTLAAVNVAQLGDATSGLAGSLEDFATLMTTWSTDADWQAVKAARDASQSFEKYPYRDLGDFMARVEIAAVAPAIASAAACVNAALDAAVVKSFAGTDIKAEGLSIYLPAPGDNSPATPYVASNQFAGDTHWDDFVLAAGAPRTVNHAPIAEAGGPYTVAEGGSVVLDASASSDSDSGEQGGTLTYLWDLDGDGAFGETGNQAKCGDEIGVSPTFSAVGIHGTEATVSLRVLDHLQVAGTDTAVVHVALVPPQVGAIAGPGALVPFQSVAYSVGFKNPIATDTHTASVSWGDGSTVQTAGVNEAGGIGVASTPAHQYLKAGNYTIAITVRDDDGSQAVAKRVVSVVGMTVGADPHQAGAKALFVGGTAGHDYVYVEQCPNGQTRVTMSGQKTGLFSPSANGHIYVFAGPGNDTVLLSPTVKRIAVIDGGGGNDFIMGGNGNNVLLGGAGNDVLFGGAGHSLLIGGAGRDVLYAGSGGDILIGGTTAYDAGQAALLSLLAEWGRSIPIDTRLAHLSQGGGLNGTSLLKKSVSVFDDGVQDTLCGGIGDDWFMPWASDVTIGRSKRDR